jgi:hypothetical protein
MSKGRTQPRTPDLFSTASTPERSPSSNPPQSSPPTTNTAGKAPSPRHVLPGDLPIAVKHLNDQELDQLLAVALAEAKRRGRSPPSDQTRKRSSPTDTSSRKRQVNAVEVPLTLGKLNAVRATFKAGVRPSQIARQFGISQSDVRKALAGDASSKASK